MATVRTNLGAGTEGATVIGESVKIQGTLSGDEDLHILGRVDGRIELQRTLVVAQSGIVKAEVSVKNAIISGVVVGNVHASESIEITKEGRMVGDVFAPRVIIVDGASFRGNVDMGDIENMPARRPMGERPRPTPVARPTAITSARGGGGGGKTTISKPAAASASSSASATTSGAAAGGAGAANKGDTSKPAASAGGGGGDSRAPDKAASSAPSKPAAATPMEPPAAKGLPQKANKTRVIVKRK